LLLIAAGGCAAPLLLEQLDGLVTAASTTTLPFSVHLVLLQPSVHELREAEDACAIKTFCRFHAPLFLIPKRKSHVAEKKQTVKYILPSKTNKDCPEPGIFSPRSMAPPLEA
jgi:hypothetical protein